MLLLIAGNNSRLTSPAGPGGAVPESLPALVSLLVPVFVLLVLAVVLGVLLAALLRRLREEAPVFESNWGGLGRGLGGWKMNGTLVLSLFTLLALVAFLAVSINVISGARKDKAEDTKKAPKAATAPAVAVEVSNVQVPPLTTPVRTCPPVKPPPPRPVVATTPAGTPCP